MFFESQRSNFKLNTHSFEENLQEAGDVQLRPFIGENWFSNFQFQIGVSRVKRFFESRRFFSKITGKSADTAVSALRTANAPLS